MLRLILYFCICKFCMGFYKEKVNDPQILKGKQFWIDDAQQNILHKLANSENRNKAKNIIFFIGDGMSVPTVTASRIYEGQQKGVVGERNQLFFESFPYLGLCKTYCVDKQVADSACTATAYFSGIKVNFATIGVTADVELSDCDGAKQKENQLDSIANWAQAAGKATGIVTTTRVTHASPAGAYAHTSDRNYESDYDIVSMGADPERCTDIAKQLVENETSKNFNVIMGGGARKLLPNGQTTDENTGYIGERLDNRNLISEWLSNKNDSAKFVYNKQHLSEMKFDEIDNLIGIFSNDHLTYNLDCYNQQPSLKEMTNAAIRVLEKNPKGYFLFVEGGRIDHAHHETKAKKALDETIQFSEAIKLAYKNTNPIETLIVVSADHGHTMTINGYPDLGNSITGIGTDLSDMDNLPYMTLSYANGPAFKNFIYASKSQDQVRIPINKMKTEKVSKNKMEGKESVERVDLRKLNNVGNKNFQYPATVPLQDETHGGGDVAVYANGPWSHLFTGVVEQNILPVIMGFASCIGPGVHCCNS